MKRLALCCLMMAIGCGDAAAPPALEHVDKSAPIYYEGEMAGLLSTKVEGYVREFGLGVTTFDPRVNVTFTYTGWDARLEMWGDGTKDRDGSFSHRREQRGPFGEATDPREVIQGSNGDLITAYCNVRFTASALFTVTTMRDAHGDVNQTLERAATPVTAGGSCVSPTVSMCASVSVASGAQVSCSASFTAGSGGVETAKWFVDGGFHSDVPSLSSPATFSGYMESGNHSLELRIVNRAGFAKNGSVAVTVGDAQPPPPPPEETTQQRGGPSGEGGGSEGCDNVEPYYIDHYWYYPSTGEVEYRYTETKYYCADEM
jgi:hypothetical protein